jgi:hypothetical protein
MSWKLKAVGVFGFASLLVMVLPAQQDATVTVDAGKTVNVLTNYALGVMMQAGDGSLNDPNLAKMLLPAGIRTIRYPDGWDGVADLYHWSTYRPNKWENSNPPKVGYYPPQNDFGHFALQLDKVGSALITVNYGTNMAGNGGGDPVEAAAWVAYANGDPASNSALGKDASGHDWNTVGYWATMRASAPLTDDDGYNFLRINHPAPLHIKLWEVGNQVYNNGYYGDTHGTETDWHAPYPENAKENSKRHHDSHLSPAAYAAGFKAFAQAMKAVDPSIMVGASMALPAIDYGFAPDWDQDVLKDACKEIDFVSLQWQPSIGSLPPDWKHMDEDQMLSVPENDLSKIMKELLYIYGKDCPAGHIPKVAFSSLSYPNWQIVDDAQVSGLFAAHTMALLTEMGSVNIDWNEFHQKGLYSDDNKPLPVFYGIQMLHIIAFQPGDLFVGAEIKGNGIVAHATHRRSGLYGVMLINKDGHSSSRVKVVFNNAKIQAEGIRFDYGGAQAKANTGPARSDLKMDGNSVIVTIPPYSMVDIVVPEAK